MGSGLSFNYRDRGTRVTVLLLWLFYFFQSSSPAKCIVGLLHVRFLLVSHHTMVISWACVLKIQITE